MAGSFKTPKDKVARFAWKQAQQALADGNDALALSLAMTAGLLESHAETKDEEHAIFSMLRHAKAIKGTPPNGEDPK